MLRRRSALSAAIAVVTSLVLATTGAGAAVTPAQTVTDLLPNLQVGPIADTSLVLTTNGQLRLRFGTTAWNAGDGPFEADGVQVDPNDKYMVVRQRIYDSAAGSHTRRTPSVMANDLLHQHKQYQIVEFVNVQMYKANHPERDVESLRKVAYCVLDNAQVDTPPETSPPDPVYTSCGDKTSTEVTLGLSVGYRNDVAAASKDEWMDVTGITTGRYRICATVDPLGQFVETDETDNQGWTDVRINPTAMTVVVKATGTDACGPNVPVPPAR